MEYLLKDKFNLPTEVVLFMLIGGYENYLTDSSAVILLIVCNKHDYMLAGFIWCYDGDTGKAYALWDIAYCGLFAKRVFGFWESVLWLWMLNIMKPEKNCCLYVLNYLLIIARVVRCIWGL